MSQDQLSSIAIRLITPITPGEENKINVMQIEELMRFSLNMHYAIGILFIEVLWTFQLKFQPWF